MKNKHRTSNTLREVVRHDPVVRCIKWRTCEFKKGCVLAIAMERPVETRGFICPITLKLTMWTAATMPNAHADARAASARRVRRDVGHGLGGL